MSFVDQDTLIKIHANVNETVISGSHRAQDLIPAFLDVIRETAEYAKITIPAYALEDEGSDWWESEDCSYLLNEELFSILNSYAPDGYYFGAHPGNGSDFGFWEYTED